jgi:hypothetical protein
LLKRLNLTKNLFLQKTKIFAENEEISLKIQVTVQVSHKKLAA